MIKPLTAVALLFVMTGTAVVVAADAIIFKKVDVFEMEGEDEKKRDAQMDLDAEALVTSPLSPRGASTERVRPPTALRRRYHLTAPPWEHGPPERC